MGCFGYICPVCKTGIRGDCSVGGEFCILIHKRHGKEIGRTVGHYDEYGRVVEDKDYRSYENTCSDGSVNLNTHGEICDSEMRFPDSNAFGRKYILPDGKNYDRDTYSVGIGHFESMDRNFPSFSENFTPEIKEKVAYFKKAKELLLSSYRPGTIYGSQEKKMIQNYREADMHMPEDLQLYFTNWIESLPPVIPQSGTVAVHKKCYDSLTEEQQKLLPISDSDPDQSWGKVRKKYS